MNLHHLTGHDRYSNEEVKDMKARLIKISALVASLAVFAAAFAGGYHP